MREWIPISTSPRGRLALAAVRAFGSTAYESVTVGQLAAAADVTTGALYHHFDSKLGLYAIARTDVERRLLDRMEGAAAAAAGDPGAAAGAALRVGFDFAVAEDFTRLLGDPAPAGAPDTVAELVTRLCGGPALGRVLVAAWRAAVVAVADGVSVADARAALIAVTPRGAAPG